MAVPAEQPDARLVLQFLRGQLAEPEHSEVEQRLSESSDWLSVAEAADGHDDLLDALRGLGAAEATPLPRALGELIPRLERLVQANPAKTPLDAGAQQTVSDMDGPSLPASTDFPFLSPPQGTDELGWLGNYRVLQKLGVGGMGVVFAAEDSLLKRRVALKVMLPEVASLPNARQRFLREAQAAAALDHPNVVQIYQVAESPVPFIAMPLLAGESLADRLKRSPVVSIAEVLRIGTETAQGLAAAHTAGLIHRDIKPGNIWLALARNKDGEQALAEVAQNKSVPFQVKILDFGLVRPIDGDHNLTRQNVVLGTPAYMAPEQADGLAVTARSDLFSLGCVLYKLATGYTPFKGPTLTAVLRSVAEHEPPPPHTIRPEMPLGLSDLIMQLLNKDADKRPASAQGVAETLRSLEAVGPAPPSAPSCTAPYPPGVWSRRRRLVLSAAGILAAGVLAIGLFFALRSGVEDPPPGPGLIVAPAPPPKPPVVYRGTVDILVWRTIDGETRKLRLTDRGALPLSPGDQIRVTAHIEPAAYLYLFWIDEEGKAAPVYPWEPGKWGTRPPKEEPVDALDLPGELSKGFTITPGREGMETLLMLALDAPLAAEDEDLIRRLDGLPPPRPVQNALAAVWFENGKVVEHDPLRTRADFVLADINDPVLRLQERLRQQLLPLARYSAAVSFARQGKK